MLPVTIGFDPGMSLNAPCPAPKGGGAAPAAAGPGSFHTLLRDAAAGTAEAPADTAPAQGENAGNETGRAAADKSRAQPTRRQDLTAGADRNADAAEAPADSAPTQSEEAVNETGRAAAAADDRQTRPTRRSAANDTEDPPVWALLAQIIQELTAAAETNAVTVEGEGDAVASGPAENDAVASGPAAGDAVKDLAALVDLLKQLQESPGVLTAESSIPLDRLRQMLEQWQAGANESKPGGLPGRLLDLLKNVQEALPGIARDQWAAAGNADAAVPADELSDQDRPAADARGPGAKRVMAAPPTAAAPPAETLRSTAVSSKAQASENSFVLPKNFEVEDTPSGGSDDSRSPAEKATAGVALATADNLAEESGAPSLRFDAALRDVRSFAVTDGSPDKPAEAPAAAKGRDTAAAPGKTDVFDQIVQRAAVQVKSGQGEMRIDLKPEFLGHVRLQIVTENQQVSVRILTELPMVRDMIEGSIQQLKSDLQQQGLLVERVEVAVSDDPRQHPGRQARNFGGRKGDADADVAPAAAETSAGLRPEAAYRWGLSGQTTINMFA
jgi:flagellar hook-length control protein FliK